MASKIVLRDNIEGIDSYSSSFAVQPLDSSIYPFNSSDQHEDPRSVTPSIDLQSNQIDPILLAQSDNHHNNTLTPPPTQSQESPSYSVISNSRPTMSSSYGAMGPIYQVSQSQQPYAPQPQQSYPPQVQSSFAPQPQQSYAPQHHVPQHHVQQYRNPSFSNPSNPSQSAEYNSEWREPQPETITLEIRQQPKEGVVTADGKEKSRKPIDPPPVIQMRMSEAADPHKHHLQSPYFFMTCSVVSKDSEEPQSNMLMGTVVSSLHRLKDIDNKDGGFFVFGDLSAKKTGTYRLHFCLFDMRGTKDASTPRAVFMSEIFSEPFKVLSAKEFRGMEESTYLSRAFSDQGVRLRLRKEPRAAYNKKRSRSDDDESQAPVQAPSQDYEHDNREEELIRSQEFPIKRQRYSESSNPYSYSSYSQPTQSGYNSEAYPAATSAHYSSNTNSSMPHRMTMPTHGLSHSMSSEHLGNGMGMEHSLPSNHITANTLPSNYTVTNNMISGSTLGSNSSPPNPMVPSSIPSSIAASSRQQSTMSNGSIPHHGMGTSYTSSHWHQ